MNPQGIRDIVKLLKEAPSSSLDASMQPLILKWSDPPKALEVLEVLDAVVHGSLAGGVAHTVLCVLYEEACKAETTTHEAVAVGATWRKEG